MKTVIDYPLNAAGTVRLTNQTPAARYGIPCLSYWDGRDYGPADVLPAAKNMSAFGRFTAAQAVDRWASEINEGRTASARTTAEIEAARLFLQQWPEGPQVTLVMQPIA